jgi:hypothetical protein
MSRDEFQIFPVEHMEPRSEPYIIKLRLLECCWHPDSYLEFQPLQAHPNIGEIKRLPPEQDECSVFPGQTDYEVLVLLYSFLDPDTLFYVSTKFRSKGRSMVSIRRRFNSEILQHIQYSSLPNIAYVIPNVSSSTPNPAHDIGDPAIHDLMNLGLCTPPIHQASHFCILLIVTSGSEKAAHGLIQTICPPSSFSTDHASASCRYLCTRHSSAHKALRTLQL